MGDDSDDAKQPESVAAVLKAFAILQALSERNETGISELSVRLARPKATVYRSLQTMKTLGYVRQEVDSQRYGLSMRVFEIGAKALQYPDLIEIAKPHMQRLSEDTGETVHLGMLIDSEIICVHKVDSRRPLGMVSKIGRRAPLHCTGIGTGIGKVLMAWSSQSHRDPVLKGCDFKRFHDKTITTRAEFDVELERTLAQGFGQGREEFDEHIRCAAIPNFDRASQVVAGISVSFPSFRYDLAREPELVANLAEASRDTSRQLGWTHFPLGTAAVAGRP